MSVRACPRQPEVLDLVSRGHWPQACPAELSAHLEACRTCFGLLRVTHAFRQARAEAAVEAKLPAPGAIWWRAQLRRRQTAVESMGRPIFGAYVFALACVGLFAAALAVSQARRGLRWLDWALHPETAPLHAEAFSPSAWLASGGSLAVLISAFAMFLLLCAVAVYFAQERQ